MFIRPFSFDPVTGIKETFTYDPETDRCVIVSEQPVGALLELNQAERNEPDANKVERGDKEVFKLVARLPLTVHMDLLKRGILRDKQAMKRWLNDPANRMFRTNTMRV